MSIISAIRKAFTCPKRAVGSTFGCGWKVGWVEVGGIAGGRGGGRGLQDGFRRWERRQQAWLPLRVNVTTDCPEWCALRCARNSPCDLFFRAGASASASTAVTIPLHLKRLLLL